MISESEVNTYEKNSLGGGVSLLNKENKKSVFKVVMCLLLLFVVGEIIFLSNSYALFKKEIAGRNVELKVGELSYNLESEKLKNNQITLKPNSSETFEVTLTSLNEIDSKYELFYKIISPETIENTVDGGYLETSVNPSSGIIESEISKIIQLVINNTGSQEIVTEVGVQAGLIQNDIILNEGEITFKEINFQKHYVFDYTGESQEFIAPTTGSYKVELWGASGYNGGGGAYTSGLLTLSEQEELYVYVGSQPSTYRNGGYNGGGMGGVSSQTPYGYGGGGATDIRVSSGVWSDSISLRSRIMVAAGSGGLNNISGGLTGYNGMASGYDSYQGRGGTQIAGGSAPPKYNVPSSCTAASTGSVGGFGYGGTGGNNASYTTSGGGGGGGSGYYGGSGSSGLCSGQWSGGGGSSFISGHAGCIAIKSETDQTPKVTTYSKIEDSYHYSGKIFTDTIMIDGAGYNWTTKKETKVDMPTHDLISTMTGNPGNGYARITYIGE